MRSTRGDLLAVVNCFLQVRKSRNQNIVIRLEARCTPERFTPRLNAMRVEEKGMGWHAFRRFRKTWLRGKRCQEDINNFWMGHKPKTMSELYSRMDEELEQRLQEAETVGVGFDVLAYVAPSAPRISLVSKLDVAA
jgi:hypothetical protein